MADSKLVQANEKIAKGVTEGFNKMSTGVTEGFQEMRDGVVGGYTKIEDSFVGKYLTHDGETVEDAKARLKAEQAERDAKKAQRRASGHRTGTQSQECGTEGKIKVGKCRKAEHRAEMAGAFYMVKVSLAGFLKSKKKRAAAKCPRKRILRKKSTPFRGLFKTQKVSIPSCRVLLFVIAISFCNGSASFVVSLSFIWGHRLLTTKAIHLDFQWRLPKLD